ncbi:MAG: hypothetical protein ABIQ18_41635 [Umezawaea sp.]
MHPTPPKGDDLPARPEVRTPPPVVVHGIPSDGLLFAAFGPARVGDLVWDNLDGGIVQHLMARGGLLTELVGTIKKRYQEVAEGHPAAEAGELHGPIIDEVVGLLLEERAELAALRPLVADGELDIPLPQAAAVIRFIKAYPEFWPKVMSRVKEVRFNSRAADGRGGGLFDRGMIYISKLPATPPGAFVRLLVHETGHATFEGILLGGRPMPHELDADPTPEMFERLPTGLVQVSVQADQKIRTYWDGMSASAKLFYNAWLTLRQDHGQHLLGLDLWQDPRRNRLDPEQRRRYQAGKFDEFCAETFMLYAMGDLEPHITAVLDDTVHVDVKTAWTNARTVLDDVARPILGPRVF